MKKVLKKWTQPKWKFEEFDPERKIMSNGAGITSEEWRDALVEIELSDR